MANYQFKEEVDIPASGFALPGDLYIPEGADSIVIFAHGSGSSRKSSRNRLVARALNDAGFATLLFDLLSEKEDMRYENRFNIDLLSERLILTTNWLRRRDDFDLNIGYFGASTGAAAALRAAALLGRDVRAVVSRGGRPDLALNVLPDVTAHTLLIAGSLDEPVIEFNRKALKRLAHGELHIVNGASHLFEEPGKLEEVAQIAIDWFSKNLRDVYA